MEYTKKKLTAILLVVLAALTAISCAKQGYPSGGPRDMTPPQVLSMTPASGMTYFNARSFSIGFDEFVVLNDADNNIIVSPPIHPKPQYSIKGKNLVVQLPDTLMSNVTYLFQMHGAVADFTEGNRIGDLEYAFSTGGSIDSLSMQGRVLDAYSNKPYEKTVTVLLYRLHPDSIWVDSTATKQAPSYVARCNEKGYFHFHHLADGQYRILALDDADRNLRYNGNESIAFLDTLLRPTYTPPVAHDSTLIRDSTIVRDTIPAGIELLISCDSSQTKQRITKSEFLSSSRILITTAAPMKQPQLSCGDSLIWRITPGNDSLHIWLLEAGRDSTIVVVRDSSGLNDTLRLQLRKKGIGRRHTVGGADTSSTVEVRFQFGSSVGTFDTLYLVAVNPIVHCSDTALHLLDLSDSSRHTVPLHFDSLRLRAYLDTTLPAGRKYQCTLEANVLTDLWGNRNARTEAMVEVKELDQFGNIFLTCRGSLPTRCIVQLIDSQGRVLVMRPWSEGQTRLELEHLEPGKYRIQAFSDLDDDGQWTAGNYWLHRQPEPIYRIDKTFEVRENWDIEESWQLLH